MRTIINKDDVKMDILELFYNNPKSKLYLREIQRVLKKPLSSIQRHISTLIDEGVLVVEKKGMLKFFSINQNYPYLSEMQSVILRECRRKKLEKALQKVVKKLKKYYKPDKLVLFGSLASGRVSPAGDIDLLIIKKDVAERYWERVKGLAPFLTDCDVGIDYVIWTPQEYADEVNKNLFLKEEIINKGKVLYERAA